MAGETVTRARLSEAVYLEVGLSRNESAELVEAVIAEISGALERGEIVKISSFGSFAVRQKGQRIGRNPKTGQEVPINPRRVLVFRASHALKDQRMLEGVPPADAVPLSIEGVSPDELRAWRLGKNVYLRTRYTLLSPEWTASEAEGGLTVYAVPATPVVLLSVDGRTVSALLKDPS